MNRTAVDLALLFLRLAGLGMALVHGWSKLVGLVAGDSRFVDGVARLGFPAPVVFAWMAALTEVVGGLLVALGLGTRVAAALCAFNMVVAAFLRHHAHDHLRVKLGLLHVSSDTLSAWGNPELALMYLLPFLAIALAGGGRFSLESFFRRGKGRR